jgi:hypothetical protein
MRKTKCAWVALTVMVVGALDSTVDAGYVYLRQTGNSNPNGNGVYQNGSQDTGGGAMLPFLLTNNTSQVLQLSHGSMAVSTYTDYGLKTSDMYAQGWSPSSFWSGNPFAPGDLIGRSSVPMPDIQVVGTGSIFGVSITNYWATWDVGSLLGLNLILEPGESAYFTIAVDNQSPTGGGWFARESILNDTSDTLWQTSMGYLPFETIEWTEYHGRLDGDWAFVVVPEPASVLFIVVAAALVTRRRIP